MKINNHFMIVFVYFLIISCTSRAWPRWSDQVISAIRCDMTIVEVEAATGRSLKPVNWVTYLDVYGSHAIHMGDFSVRLNFEHGRLKTVARWRPKALSFKGVQMSPRRDLCTDEVTFFLQLDFPRRPPDAKIFIDGEHIENFSWERLLEISAGTHELRIENEDYDTIFKYFTLKEETEGIRMIAITSSDLYASDVK